jgi:hypothetical protein
MTSFYRSGYKGRFLYFLHIPRTSGTYIIDNVRSLLKHSASDDELERAINNCVFTAGHTGTNPYYQDNPSFDTFAIVRNPYEQILSTASYMAKQDGDVFDEEFLEKFLSGEYKTHMKNPLFNGTPNIQTKMLGCRVVELDGFVMRNRDEPYKNSAFMESDLSKYSSIEEIVGDKTILCFDNREYIEKWISDTMFSMVGLRMGRFGGGNVNSADRHGITLSAEQKRHIRNTSELDFELYEYSKRLSG